MDEGYDDDEGGRRRGGGGGGRASSRATTVAAAPIANEVLVANLGKIADKRRAAPIVVTPPASSLGEGWDGGVFVFVFVASTDVARTRRRPCDRSCCLPNWMMQTLENEIHAAAASIESFDSTFVHCGYKWV
jgi:hypothetical protein